MKALSASVVAMVLAALPIVCSPAASDQKTLLNKVGTVTYGPSKTPTKGLATNGSVALNDNDYAQTAANSLASITLPDSSVVTMGQNSSVQMASFDNTAGLAKATFVVVGKVRFEVKHPAGAQANYTFQTATGQIAVRGTIGDIAALTNSGGAPLGLQVNVYALGTSGLPVQVTLVTGQTFTLAAGQSLVVSAAASGALVSSVGAVSNSTFAPFSQLGAPANAGSLGITTTTTTTAAAGSAATTTAATTAATTTATTAIAATTVGVAAATTVGTQQPKATDSPTPTPSPSPTPTASSTSVPIVIQNQPKPAAPAAVPAPGAPSRPSGPSVGAPANPVMYPFPPRNGGEPIERPSPRP